MRGELSKYAFLQRVVSSNLKDLICRKKKNFIQREEERKGERNERKFELGTACTIPEIKKLKKRKVKCLPFIPGNERRP